jgi:hypothetical protein
LPFQDLVEAHKIHKPEYVLSIITSTPGQDAIQEYVGKVCNKFPDSKVLLSGYQVVGQDLKVPTNGMIINKIEDLIAFTDANN